MIWLEKLDQTKVKFAHIIHLVIRKSEKSRQ